MGTETATTCRGRNKDGAPCGSDEVAGSGRCIPHWEQSDAEADERAKNGSSEVTA